MNEKATIIYGAITYGNILNDICSTHECDNCPMSDQFGVCRPKQTWPNITVECVRIALKYREED